MNTSIILLSIGIILSFLGVIGSLYGMYILKFKSAKYTKFDHW